MIRHPGRDAALGVLVAALAVSGVGFADQTSRAFSTYESFSDSLYRGPIPVPPEGIHLEIDETSWYLDEGTFFLGAELDDGRATGLVFEGSGHIEMPVPDRHELYQLRRFMERPEVTRFETGFSRLVLRTSDPDVLRRVGPATGPESRQGLARERERQCLERRGEDVDARVLGATLIPDDLYVRVEMDSPEHGWVTWEFDAQRLEEVHLDRLHGPSGLFEFWLSLERHEDRAITRQDDWRPLVDIEHVDVEADMKDPDDGVVVASITFTATTGPLEALPFRLSSIARMESVEDDAGNELDFLRALVDKRGGYDDLYTPDMLVILAAPIERGESHTLRFHYHMDLEGYAAGNGWYPQHGPEDAGLRDRYTGRLTITIRKGYDVRAMGRSISRSQEGALRTATWEIDRPVKMLTFTSLRAPVEQRMAEPGAPEIIVFGPEKHENIYFNIAADLTNSILYYQQIFDDELETESLKAGMVTEAHGQSFEGFLHLSYADLVEHPGATELFRGHEVAHQWWGHIVGWDRYRDQWLSEAFAEYSAMMYVAASLDNGDKLFDEILRTYSEELTGSIKSAFSKFSRPGVALLNAAATDRIGPIAHGWRATVHEAPTAYFSLTYRKGALVLHMLRGVLRVLTKSDDAFLDILRDFIDTYRDDSPSTADFEAMVAKHAPADWSWFFDEWVYGCDIPTYLWDYGVAPNRDGGGGYTVTLRVTQHNVPDGFRMLVPVEVRFSGDQVGRLAVMIDEPEEEIAFAVPQKPRKVVFNPDYAVLARTKKK